MQQYDKQQSYNIPNIPQHWEQGLKYSDNEIRLANKEVDRGEYFQPDNKTKKILNDVPTIYHDFLINYGLKLVAETDLFYYLIKDDALYFKVDNEDNEDKVLTERKNKKEKAQPAQHNPLVSTPSAAAGFDNW